MFSLLLEKPPSEDDIPEETEEEEEEEEPPPPDEFTTFLDEEIRECFALFDKNKSGTFETRHLDKALRCLGIFLTSTEMNDLRIALDSNGTVKFEQFYECAMEKMKESDPIDALKIAFRTFDPDKEGIIQNDRFKRWMTTVGNPLTEKETKDLIKMGDPSGKGFIIYDDLAMILFTG